MINGTYGIYHGKVHRIGFDICDKYGYNLMVKKSDIEVIVEKKPYKL